MEDLINRRDAIDAIGKASDELYENIKKGATFPQRQCFDGMAKAQSILENLPSAQPEIIHCRECKYAHLTYDGDCKQCDQWLDDDDFHLKLYLDGDFYCGYAERRTDE